MGKSGLEQNENSSLMMDGQNFTGSRKYLLPIIFLLYQHLYRIRSGGLRGILKSEEVMRTSYFIAYSGLLRIHRNARVREKEKAVRLIFLFYSIAKKSGNKSL